MSRLIEHAKSIARTTAGLSLAVAVMASTPAVAQPSDELIAAAKEEGSGVVYTNTDPNLVQALADAFEARYGIPVEVQRQSSSALAQRFTAERESGNNLADVYFSTDRPFHEDSIANGVFTPTLDGVPGIEDWPEHAKIDGAVIVAHTPYSIVFNTDLAPDGLDDWEDLIDPQFAGMLMLTDPRSSVNSNQFYKMLREKYGDDFLRQLGENATYSPSAVPGIQQVAAGAQAVYAPGIHPVYLGLVADGAPLGETFPEPTISSDSHMSVVAEASHPNFAKLFIGCVMSMEGQQINNNDAFSPLDDVPGTRKRPEIVQIDPNVAKAESEEMARLMGL